MTERIKRLNREDPAYPGRLLPLENMPRILYGYGKLPQDQRPSLAVVGARTCSIYGKIWRMSFPGCWVAWEFRS